MAITKILARHARMDVCIRYVLNEDKTEERILTAYHNCTPQNPYGQMKQTKQDYGKEAGVQCYHIIQSFAKGEIEPERALEIAQRFCDEYLPGYEAVIGTHVDRAHIHNHICFNSVEKYSGRKYHSTPQSYFKQIRGVSDALCREYGLSIVMTGETSKAVSYIEWLKEQRGQPTLRGMLEQDLEAAINQAADYGHFLMLMEHMGYSVKHGKHLAFQLWGTDKAIRPGRKDARYTEEGVRAAIEGSLMAMEQPPLRKRFVPYKPRGKVKGFMALYVHYLYLLGQVKKGQYPKQNAAQLKWDLFQFEKYKEQFAFLRKHDIASHEDARAFQEAAKERIAKLTKERTILNVQKKRRQALYAAAAKADALKATKDLYREGIAGAEEEFTAYLEAVEVMEKAGVPAERIREEKAKLYEKLAEVNRTIREEKHQLAICEAVLQRIPWMEKEIRKSEREEKEVVIDEHRRR